MSKPATCGSCHSWRHNHPDLPPNRCNGCYGLCVSPWKGKSQVQHEQSTRCIYWIEREPECQQRQCPGCGATVWRWLHDCPECGHDLRPKPDGRKVKIKPPPGGRNHGYLGPRRFQSGY
jgi:hypothetical protein